MYAGFGYRIGTGSVGIGPLFRTLHAAGRDDVIYQIVTNPASPGYAYLVNSGHTTLSENLSGGGSQDHHLLGEVDSWLVHGLAGIQQDSDSIGYKHILIKPAVVGDLADVKGSYATPAGDVTSHWKRTPDGVNLEVTVPDNVMATFRSRRRRRYGRTRRPATATRCSSASRTGASFTRSTPGIRISTR